MPEMSPESEQRVVELVRQELAKAQTMPAPGNVTEVVFRMGTPDAVHGLGVQNYCICPCCTAPPLDEILDELEFSPDVEGIIRRLEEITNQNRGDVLVTLLKQVLASEARAYVTQFGP